MIEVLTPLRHKQERFQQTVHLANPSDILLAFFTATQSPSLLAKPMQLLLFLMLPLTVRLLANVSFKSLIESWDVELGNGDPFFLIESVHAK